MWMVRSRRASVQDAHAVYVPRASLPTDAECGALFAAMETHGHARWALAMRLKHRAGLRWGELTPLQANDVGFDSRRAGSSRGRNDLPRPTDRQAAEEREGVHDDLPEEPGGRPGRVDRVRTGGGR